MTENFLTGTLSLNTNKQTNTMSIRVESDKGDQRELSILHVTGGQTAVFVVGGQIASMDKTLVVT